MNTQIMLPRDFAALEPFAAYWSVASLSGRDTRRLDSSEGQRAAFYNAARDIAPVAIEYLDSKPFAQYDDADHRLLDLMLALIHVALAVEVERDEEHIHARGARLMPIVRERTAPRALTAA